MEKTKEIRKEFGGQMQEVLKTKYQQSFLTVSVIHREIDIN